MTAHDRTPAPPLDEADLQRIEARLAVILKNGCGPITNLMYDDVPALIESLRAAWPPRDEAIRQRDELRAETNRLRAELRETDRERDADAVRIDQLRAILDDTLRVIHGEFCGVVPHPVCEELTARRDALLGWDRAPAHPEGDAT